MKSQIADKNWEIESGPRRKLLATEHLEFIIHALLDPKTKVRCTRSWCGDWLLNIYGKTFNLSAILASRPDFEQFNFSKEVLDAYLSENRSSPVFLLNSKSNPHLAESIALEKWANIGGAYEDMQNILENHLDNLCWESIKNNLMHICIASYALSKPLESSLETKCRSFRKEKDSGHLDARRESAAAKTVLSSPRFFAASTDDSLKNFGNVRTVIYQAPSMNPLGKYIATYVHNNSEEEVLFPPNTEFKFSFDGTGFEAEPIRTANPTFARPYKHGLSPEDITTIENDLIKIKNNLKSASAPHKNPSLLTRLYNFTLSTTPRRIATLLAFIFVASAIAAAIYFSGGLVIPFLGLIAIKTSPVTLGLILGALGLSAAGLLGVTVWPYVDKRGGGIDTVVTDRTTEDKAGSSQPYQSSLREVFDKKPPAGRKDNEYGGLTVVSCDVNGDPIGSDGEEMEAGESMPRNKIGLK